MVTATILICLDLYFYVVGEGTGLFDEFVESYRLDLVSSTALSNEIVGLQYRRYRIPAARQFNTDS